MLSDTAVPVRRGPAHRTRVRDGRGAPLARAKDVLLTVLGVVGILSVLCLAAAWALHLSVVVFVTGSMAPTMPTGSAAVVQRVPVSDLAVGDVVTVPQPRSGTPVTHRVVAIEDAPDRPDARVLRLKGDANEIVDPVTYTVAEAHRVIASAPGLGAAAIGVRSPMAMAGITVAIALAIVWALWPARRAPDAGAGP